MYPKNKMIELGGKKIRVSLFTDDMPRDNPIGIYASGEEGSHIVEAREEDSLRLILVRNFRPWMYREASFLFQDIVTEPERYIRFE